MSYASTFPNNQTIISACSRPEPTYQKGKLLNNLFSIMQRGKLPPHFKKGQIISYHRECVSIRGMADILERSPKCVLAFLKKKDKPNLQESESKVVKYTQQSNANFNLQGKEGRTDRFRDL